MRVGREYQASTKCVIRTPNDKLALYSNATAHCYVATGNPRVRISARISDHNIWRDRYCRPRGIRKTRMYEFDRPCASNIAIHCYGVVNSCCRTFLGEIHLPGNIHRLAFRPCSQIHINVVITCIADRNFRVARRNDTGVPVRRKIPVACTTIPCRRLDCCPALRRFIVGNGNVLCSATHRATRIIANDQNLSTLEGNTIGCRACHCDRSTFSRSVSSSLKR